ncbi:MAG TPA: 50S ribosomal protein L13 [Candidatus Thermoplasmatota archaeon]|jgi:large subunit ribosomal protein L13|nr:50S ribosomal protein L13 [Candidatus Thermoplasmatota archaeon]
MATIIDANGAVMGRLASHVAKRLLEGESIVIVNAEKCLITGSRDSILADYKNKRARGTQRFGPYFPRVPHLIVKRAVRGMIPYQTPRGRDAFRRLRVEIGVPAGYAKQPLVKVEGAMKSVAISMTIGQLSKDLGAKVRTQPKAVSK